jgi:hypothetical protein
MCRSWIDGEAPNGTSGRPDARVASVIRAIAVVAALWVMGWPGSADAGQLGGLVSPGALAKAHASLEGGTKCQQCHEAGRKVTPERCLACHKPIADRIASRRGVHRSATDCVACHVEHSGVNADLRHFDTRNFNHAAQTGFTLDGVHAKAASNCSACHKARSFLDARTACSSCHADVHKPSLGADCTRCHSTQAAFKQSGGRFDHAKARFQLTGAHRDVTCEKCHKTGVFRDAALFSGRPFGACAACHQDPHQKKFGADCASCHTTQRWVTGSVDHSKTAFPLAGAHAQVACAKCHQGNAATRPVRFDQCSACHANVHRESIKEDCRACHTEAGFKGATFDHAQKTGFVLEGKHEGLACAKCHTNISDTSVPLASKVVDYRGAERACVSCHDKNDPHKGTFGRACDSCHRPAGFAAREFTHPRAPDFYSGQHAAVSCEKCHLPDLAPRPVMAKAPVMACAACHADVHLGQEGAACERCHAVTGVKFAAVGFSHDQSPFPLTGAHRTLECAKCHRTETRDFPSRTGTAVAYRSVASGCVSCHKDPHLGQVDGRCETCHQTATFKLPAFTHRGMDDFFGGFHGKYACKDCHKTETGAFPSGQGTAVRFKVGRTCTACHRQF